MGTHNSYEYGRREFHLRREDDGALALTLLAVTTLAGCLYVLATRFYLRPLQLAELALDLSCLMAILAACSRHVRGRRARVADAWPHPPVFIPRLRDDRYVRRAFSSR